MKAPLLFIFIVLIITGCNDDFEKPEINDISFGPPQKAYMIDYDGHIMEPFLSRDGTILFFNNLNHSTVNTNLHSATRINDSVFQYQGELKGVNTEFLEGVPSMDSSDIFYFISTRSYNQTLSTIYSGVYFNDSIMNIQLVSGISNVTAGWINFDAEVSKDGGTLFFATGLYDANGGPYESNLDYVVKTNNTFQKTDHSIFNNINTEALEYGACISSNMLELYFTRAELPLSKMSTPQIYLSTRKTVTESFEKAYKIENITGFVEAPTLSPDNQIIYYHKKENEKYVLYLIRKNELP
ncbi:MAG: hypothetical protein R6V16_01970 [Bacteroidales bacterium]